MSLSKKEGHIDLHMPVQPYEHFCNFSEIMKEIKVLIFFAAQTLIDVLQLVIYSWPATGFSTPCIHWERRALQL